jgi:hypothetical protein
MAYRAETDILFFLKSLVHGSQPFAKKKNANLRLGL